MNADMEMHCDRCRELLLDGLEEPSLQSDLAGRMRRHLRECPACANLRDELQAALASLPNLPVERPPADLAERTLRAIEADLHGGTDAQRTPDAKPVAAWFEPLLGAIQKAGQWTMSPQISAVGVMLLVVGVGLYGADSYREQVSHPVAAPTSTSGGVAAHSSAATEGTRPATHAPLPPAVLLAEKSGQPGQVTASAEARGAPPTVRHPGATEGRRDIQPEQRSETGQGTHRHPRKIAKNVRAAPPARTEAARTRSRPPPTVPSRRLAARPTARGSLDSHAPPPTFGADARPDSLIGDGLASREPAGAARSGTSSATARAKSPRRASAALRTEASTNSPGTRSPGEVVQQAEAQLAADKPQAALELLIQIDGSSLRSAAQTRWILGLARAHRALGQPGKALARYEQGDVFDRVPEALIEAAECAIQLRNLPLARTLLDRAASIPPLRNRAARIRKQIEN